MLTLNDFIKIARYGNDHWKGCFSEREIIENAEIYKADYDYSFETGKPTHSMVFLCTNIVEDMDYMDYADVENVLDLKTINKILNDLLETL